MTQKHDAETWTGEQDSSRVDSRTHASATHQPRPASEVASASSTVDSVEELRKQRDALAEACLAIIGRGYVVESSPLATQDYVSKAAIAKVRAVLKKYGLVNV